MASSSVEPSTPLKGKLSQVKYLLDNANERLQEEAAKYDIFTTQTSASTSTPGITSQIDETQRDNHDLFKTISDISTLKSVLSCSLFNSIVNVTDSLDQLSYQLNLHPSIGPSDINIGANGELILAPPIEPALLNNLINTKLDEFSEQSTSNLSPRLIRSPEFNNHLNEGDIDDNNGVILNDHYKPRVDGDSHQQQRSSLAQISTNFESLEGISNDGYIQQADLIKANHNINLIEQQHLSNNFSSNIPSSTRDRTSFVNSHNQLNAAGSFETEKLVSNGANKSKIHLKSETERTHRCEALEKFDENRNEQVSEHGPRNLDEINTQSCKRKDAPNQDRTTLNKIDRSDDPPLSSISMSGPKSFSNDAYSTSYDVNQSENMADSGHRQPTRVNGSNRNLIIKNVHNQSSAATESSLQFYRGSCSPSISVGSTVRLADECDSGASSFLSQTAKSPYYQSNMPTSKSSEHSKDSAVASPTEEIVNSIEQDLMDNIYPDMERIKVTLEKDENGLGITVGGYTCEEDEISGMFIRNITPGSPADRSKKIKSLDQIYSVNGKIILGYSNTDALRILKHTGKTVTLELMRYLAASKYHQLRSALGQASHQKVSQRDISNSENSNDVEKFSQGANVTVTPMKSTAPVSKLREANTSPSKFSDIPRAERSLEHSSPSQQQATTGTRQTNPHPNQKNDAASPTKVNSSSHGASGEFSPNKRAIQNTRNQTSSQIPVAAQRNAISKVIETKHGPRNTVEIKSPVFQTATATFTKANMYESESTDSAKKIPSQLKRESSDEFGRLIPSGEPEWEKTVQIIELYKDPTQGLGFTVKEYANPMDRQQSIIMVISLTPGGVAERDGRLAVGDLLIFVDGTSLEGASLDETVKALKKTSGQVRLGVLKFKRN